MKREEREGGKSGRKEGSREGEEGRREGGREGSPHRFFRSHTAHHESQLWHLLVVWFWTKCETSLSLVSSSPGWGHSQCLLHGAALRPTEAVLWGGLSTAQSSRTSSLNADSYQHWKYRTAFERKFGAQHFPPDIFKKPDDVNNYHPLCLQIINLATRAEFCTN